jgi:hypothetical protein
MAIFMVRFSGVEWITKLKNRPDSGGFILERD